MTDSIKSIPMARLANLSNHVELSRSKYLGRLRVTLGEGAETLTVSGSKLINKAIESASHQGEDKVKALEILAKLATKNNPKPKTLIARICQTIARWFSSSSFNKLNQYYRQHIQEFNSTQRREIGLKSVQRSGTSSQPLQGEVALQNEDPALQAERQRILARVSQNSSALQHASEVLRNDRDFILAAVRLNGMALGYASQELRNDRNVVLAAIRKRGCALVFASEELRNDRDVVLAAVTQEGFALQYASETLRNDREIVLAAVRSDGTALQNASETLRNDREIVMAAVRQDGLALQFASEALRNDREIVAAAIAQNPEARRFAGLNIQLP